MRKAKLLVRGQKVPIEQQKVVQARVMWNVPCIGMQKAVEYGILNEFGERVTANCLPILSANMVSVLHFTQLGEVSDLFFQENYNGFVTKMINSPKYRPILNILPETH